MGSYNSSCSGVHYQFPHLPMLWHYRMQSSGTLTHTGCVAPHIDGLVQERHNSIANALELRISCTNPLITVQVGMVGSWSPGTWAARITVPAYHGTSWCRNYSGYEKYRKYNCGDMIMLWPSYLHNGMIRQHLAPEAGPRSPTGVHQGHFLEASLLDPYLSLFQTAGRRA